MNKVEKIKAYLEDRRKKLEDIKNRNEWTTAELGDLSCCKQTLSFIDSLSDTEKDFSIKESVIPFGASDSELMESTYFIPQGYHAVIEGNKVIIKKGEDPISNDLEEVAMQYAKSKHKDTTLQQIVSWDFKAGAQWQKEQDQSTIELAEDHAMLAGMEKMKEEMMNDAVDGVVFTKLDDGSIMARTHYFKSDKIDYLDEVKLIIIKEE